MIYQFISGLSRVTSPTVYNNATLPAQCQLSSCCIYKGTDWSILCYADDVFNISRTISGLENVFWRYVKTTVILDFPEMVKNVIFWFLMKYIRLDQISESVQNYGGRLVNISIDLNGTEVKPCVKLKYLGPPIGKNLKKTRLLMLESMETKIRRAYGRRFIWIEPILREFTIVPSGHIFCI